MSEHLTWRNGRTASWNVLLLVLSFSKEDQFSFFPKGVIFSKYFQSIMCKKTPLLTLHHKSKRINENSWLWKLSKNMRVNNLGPILKKLKKVEFFSYKHFYFHFWKGVIVCTFCWLCLLMRPISRDFVTLRKTLLHKVC